MRFGAGKIHCFVKPALKYAKNVFQEYVSICLYFAVGAACMIVPWYHHSSVYKVPTAPEAYLLR